MSKSPKKEFSNNNSNSNSDSDSDSDNERSPNKSRENDNDSDLDELVSYLSAENRNAFLVANVAEAQEFLQRARRARTRSKVRAQGPGSFRFIGPPVPSHITAKRHAAYRMRVKEEQERRRRHEAAVKYFAEQDRASKSKTSKQGSSKHGSKSRANALRAVAERKRELAEMESRWKAEERMADAARRRAARDAAMQDPTIKRHLKRGYQLVEPSPVTRGETARNLLRRYLKRFGMRTLGSRTTRKV